MRIDFSKISTKQRRLALGTGLVLVLMLILLLIWNNGRLLKTSVVHSDGDGIPDDQDNCWCINNAAQNDDDGDGFGNKCDESDPNFDESTRGICSGGAGGGGGGDGGGGGGECSDASKPFTTTFDVPEGAETYQDATFHSRSAGCGPTTEEAGSGGSVLSFTPGGTYTIRWNPSLDEACGRYQYDVALFRADGSRLDGQGVGVVPTGA